MKAVLSILALIAAAGAAAGWFLSRPAPLPEDALAGLTAEAERGAVVFAAMGCASCHAVPGGSGDGPPVLAGGQRFETDFGTFVAPNISTDPTHGIGGWSDLDLANAVLRGISPEGAHYYPAFPYTSYTRADLQDVVDMIAHLRTLPADPTPSLDHDLGFPVSLRRGVGLWKWRYMSDDWVVTGDLTETQARGRYLVEALGHCGECHTPRDAFGGPDRARWLSGAPNPDGEGRIPDITPARLTWSEDQIAEYLLSGFTPEFDTAGGSMAAVVRNTAQLPASDRAAIAAYLKIVPGSAD